MKKVTIIAFLTIFSTINLFCAEQAQAKKSFTLRSWYTCIAHSFTAPFQGFLEANEGAEDLLALLEEHKRS